MSYYSWRPYVSVAQRRAKARKEMEKLRKKGMDIQPIELESRTIASSYWGKAWCGHLESFADYDYRLERGRTYVRNGSVCHLEIRPGYIQAFVSGSGLYKVGIEIKPLAAKRWKAIQAKCRGQIGSVLELLQGRLSSHVMGVVSDPAEGLFPQPGEIRFGCNCPDWASMCKHVAAVLYGIGSRLDQRPELLFVLRGVDAADLISDGITLPAAHGGADGIAEEALAGIFGVDIDAGSPPPAEPARKPRKGGKASNGRAGSSSRAKSKATDTPKPAAAPAKSARAPRRRFNPKAPTGKGVASLRRALGLSQGQFAKALGVSPLSVQRWEAIPGPLRLYTRPLNALVRLQDEYLQR